MMGQLVKVRKETLAACMTCLLCNKLLKEATTISLCLHTFCRKCIYEKFSDEEDDCCPVCNIDLGCIPVEKLRPDHNLQDIRAKIFPLKRKKISAVEIMPSISPLPTKRKERSLSSLVVNTPKIPMHTSLTGKRTKAAKKSTVTRGSGFGIIGPIKKENEFFDNKAESSRLAESLYKISQSKRKNSSMAEHSNDQNYDAWEGKADLWKPLNCLLEAANRTKSSSKFNSQGLYFPKIEPLNTHENDIYTRKNKAKTEIPNTSDSETYMPETKSKVKGQKWKVEDENNMKDFLPGPVKRRKLRAREQQYVSPQDVLDTVGVNRERRNCPIWFSLVASEEQEGEEPLPQIPSCYLRVKDGNLPVSTVQKYLAKKLDLSSEFEVNLTCKNEPIVPTMQLHDLVDLWLHTSPTMSRRVTATIGNSAKDFMMVLSYSRKRVPIP